MNIEQAKSVPLQTILELIGARPVKERKNELWYLSPIRNENTASFHINVAKNVWYDFGTGQGGTVIDFVCAYLDNCNEPATVADALRWTGNMSGHLPTIKQVEAFSVTHKDPGLILKNAKTLKHQALINYINSRGISQDVVLPYLKEVQVHNKTSKKDFFALGLLNEEGGHEVRNPIFKGCVGPKGISFIRGKQPKPNGIHVFEGFMDCFSAMAAKKIHQFDEDTIILNSLSCLKQATPYIRNYGYRIAYTWLDNDLAGQKGTQALAEFFKTEENLLHRPMNDIYLSHKDVNAWHMDRLSLSL